MQQLTTDEFLAKINTTFPIRKQVVDLCKEYFCIYFDSSNGSEKKYTENALRKLYYKKAPKVKKEAKKVIEQAPPKTIDEQVNDEINESRKDAKIRELDKKYKYLISVNDELIRRCDAALCITEPIQSLDIPPLFMGTKDEATALVGLSDWHFEERVNPSTINNINEYNPKIAEKRWMQCAQNILRLVKKERAHSNMDRMILWLGGDFITGYIHDELIESNYMSPTEAILFSKRLIISMIDFIMKYGQLEELIIPCNYGNHGRVNQKPKVSTANINSYEWMMYHDLKNYYSHNTKIKFMITNGIYNYLTIYNKTLRTFHGDHIKFGGGIGGLTIPLIKTLMRADEQQKADYNIMGHFHQYIEATSNCLINGSGIGYGAYAQRIGARPEIPIQAFRTIDKKRWLTAKYPIFCQ